MVNSTGQWLSFATLPLLLVAAGMAHAEVGESAVITLVFPYGARSTGMGETGVALADDEAVVFFNPAGTGAANPRFTGGSFSPFYEPLLPAFGIKELWHTSGAGCLQVPNTDIGGFGASINYLNMGINTWTDELGRELGWAHSFEWVATLAWGFELDDLGAENHHGGIALKLIESALAPGYGPRGEGAAHGWAADVGYLGIFKEYWRVGAVARNMGPDVFYIDRDQSDPIPFTIDLAAGYKRTISDYGLRILDIATEFRFSREIVENYWDRPPDPFWKAIFTDLFDEPLGRELKQACYHLGFEMTVFNTGSIRNGILIDITGERYESTFGIGWQIVNHYGFDMSYIYAPEGHMTGLSRVFDRDGMGANGARHGQWRVSFSLFGLGNWSPLDPQWWLEPSDTTTR